MKMSRFWSRLLRAVVFAFVICIALFGVKTVIEVMAGIGLIIVFCAAIAIPAAIYIGNNLHKHGVI